ncbi:hypothetical protein ES705_16861 [subsurface metagenome]
MENLEIGTLVKDGNAPEYARVKECVHGNLYYAYLGGRDTLLGYSETEIDEAVIVEDWNEDKISECCG